MSFSIKNRYLLICLLAVFVGLFLLGGYIGHRRAVRQNNALAADYNDQIRAYSYRIDSLTKYAKEKDQIITTQREAIKNGEIERKELKALNLKQASQLTSLNFRIDTLLAHVAHSGQIVVIHDTISTTPKNALLLPFNFQKTDKWLNLGGTFNNEGKLDMGLKLNLDVDVWSGLDRDTKQYKAIVTTTCPYVNVIGINSQKFDLAKPKRFGLGVNIGYGLILGDPVKTAPYIGLGAAYNFIRF